MSVYFSGQKNEHDKRREIATLFGRTHRCATCGSVSPGDFHSVNESESRAGSEAECNHPELAEALCCKEQGTTNKETTKQSKIHQNRNTVSH